MWAPNSLVARSVCLTAALGWLASCAVGPDFHRPASSSVTHYANGNDPNETASAHGTVQHFLPGADIAADWWRLFNSRQVDAVVADALRGNPGLEAATARLREADFSLRSGYGIFYPQIDAGAAASRQRYSPVKVGSGSPGGIFNLFTLSASVNYALDVFGGERRAVEALRSQVDLQRANEQATYVALLSNVVNAVVAGAGYRDEISATRELIDLQRRQLRLAEVQVSAGTAAYSTVLSLRSRLASYEATIPELAQRLSQSDHLLTTLVGHLPAEWGPPPITLGDLTLPADLPVSLPSEMVRQRPDILMAEASAHEASAQVGVATAALFPGITLSGNYSANGANTGGITVVGGRAWDFGGQLTAPIFSGGTLWYRRKAAMASYQKSMALYRQTVLIAFEQVADILEALEHDAAASRAQDRALDAAQQALHLVQTNYEAGLSTYLEVLTADTQYHQAKINDLQMIAQRYQDTVALYVALGGGWWNGIAPASHENRP
jgi:NodT family efflux transporter outer membrane factor (OMF) lipoprotein